MCGTVGFGFTTLGVVVATFVTSGTPLDAEKKYFPATTTSNTITNPSKRTSGEFFLFL
jgi:hypothetical protein